MTCGGGQQLLRPPSLTTVNEDMFYLSVYLSFFSSFENIKEEKNY
jgi:hypothetical protein